MNYRSDNNASVSPEILEALIWEAGKVDDAYGRDLVTEKLDEAFSRFFETTVKVLPLTTGTATNAMALRHLCRSTSSVICSEESHLNNDEANAVGYFLPGVKLELLRSESGKITADALREHMSSALSRGVRDTSPCVVSVAQPTEVGTIYTISELRCLSRCVREFNLKLHVDGARFANALVSLACSPAQLTWKSGVDVLSFGATKNGGLMAEALVFFSENMPSDAWSFLKQTGHNPSKLRLISAQLLEFVNTDLLVRNARKANEQSNRLRAAIEKIPGMHLQFNPAANISFVQMPTGLADELSRQGAVFHRMAESGDNTVVRLVTSYDTSADEIERFTRIISRWSYHAA